MELGPQDFFLRNLCNFVVHIQNFSATPPRPPIFPATEISAISQFSPEILVFSPFWACGVSKWSNHPQNVFGNTFGCFWCGPKIFRPPRTQNPHFRPQKFLQGTDFRRKMLFFGCFVNVVHQKVSGTTQLFGAQKHVYVLGYSKKKSKKGLE